LLNKLKPKSEFSKNVLTLMTGTTIAQVIPIAISPILTRLYTPEDFGKYSVFLSFVLIASSIATLRYEQAIILPKSTKVVISLFKGSVYILLCMTVFLTGIFILINKIYLLLDPVLIFLFPLVILVIGLFNINIAFLNRQKEYKRISTLMIINSFSNAFLNLIMGLFFCSYMVLSLNLFLSRLIVIIYIIKKFILYMKVKISLKTIFFNLKKYDDMFKYSTPEVFLGMINNNLIIIFLTYFFSAKLSGGYFLVQRVLGIPISIFSTSFSKVFFKEFTVVKYKKQLLIATWTKLFFLILPVFIFLHLYINDIIVFVFGEKWEFAGGIAKILLPFFVINFIFSATSPAHIVLRLQHISMIFAIISLIIKGVIFIYGYFSQNFFITIKLLVLYDIFQIFLMNMIVFIKLRKI
jgi:O-antigen/teichoic acid export membrane protein